jgi:hypothetical protein
MMASDCPRFGKLFGGCRFEARYDTPRADRFGFEGMWQTSEIKFGPDGKGVVSQPPVPMQKYIRDVCVRCGCAVERSV